MEIDPEVRHDPRMGLLRHLIPGTEIAEVRKFSKLEGEKARFADYLIATTLDIGKLALEIGAIAGAYYLIN